MSSIMTDFKSFFTESVTSCKNCVIVGTFLRTKKHKILYFSEILICRRNVTVLSYPNAYCKKSRRMIPNGVQEHTAVKLK